MGKILILIFEILAVYGIYKWAYKAWKKVSITEKLDKAFELEENFEVVKKFEKEHKSLSDKSKKIEQFKKQDF